MNYKPREGIVLLEIQGVFVLAATAEAREHCRYVRKINATGAYIWEKLKDKKTEEQIAKDIAESFQIDQGVDIQKDVRTYIEALHEAGYLIDKGEQDE